MANRSAQELAENVLSLYDGVDNIQAQFRVLSKFVKSSKATLVRGSMAGVSVLTIDSSQVFRLKPFPSFMKVVLRVFSVLELKNGRIASHTDHYDFYSVLANVPFVSFFYAQFRPMFGSVSSAVIKRLVPPQAKPAILAHKVESDSNGVATAAAT
ncbi:uncharacterized protein PHALS_13762 [Plasmopara halstedii]|uniref:Uncharacterized protein n=1 Tax=Plasmopara halstedii TaxID=4781 RepID=A0A0P1AQF4_PLAHL|nr:uncharacterized protein PHALS_13762 [Plasmopara halstedii]CEG43570.1 hypothetical protein PHALS_13762 [Plasmopara halstedii]|eukprot:XP_024579939.1 hypothetical protein PHALS_13762 [Plasmopara halstedii]